MSRTLIVAVFAVFVSPAMAKWELQGSSSNFPSMAVEANVSSKQIPARLQIECPTRSEPSGMSLAVALDYNIPKVAQSDGVFKSTAVKHGATKSTGSLIRPISK
jgi:hypothetical protein